MTPLPRLNHLLVDLAALTCAVLVTVTGFILRWVLPQGSSAENEALSRSRGGFTTNVLALTDALGNPVTLILTGRYPTSATRKHYG